MMHSPHSLDSVTSANMTTVTITSNGTFSSGSEDAGGPVALYPSILTGDIKEAQSNLTTLEPRTQEVRTVQIDVVDGQFADNSTLTPSDLPELDFGELQCDLHLLVTEPLDYVYETIDVREDIPVRAIIGQVEQMSRQIDFVQTVKANGWLAGLSLNLFTPISEVESDVWEIVDIIQLMAIEQVGFQGQAFHDSIFEKLAELRQTIAKTGRQIEIIIDGGVKLEHVMPLADAGVWSITVGSGIWKSADPDQAIADFLRSCQLS